MKSPLPSDFDQADRRIIEAVRLDGRISITDLADFAKKNNTNYKLLRMFNPWLRENALTNKLAVKYAIRIPAEGFRESVYANSNDTLPLISKIKDTTNFESGSKQ